MKFLADENVDNPIVERLRKDGHIILFTHGAVRIRKLGS